jgi:hypothetical protein
MERVVNLNEGENSFDSFDKELWFQINSSYLSLSDFNLSDCLYDSINNFSSILYFDFLLFLGGHHFNLFNFNKFLIENDFKYQFSEEKCKQRRKTQEEKEKELRDKKKGNYFEDLNPSIESYFDNQTAIRLSPCEDLFLLILLWSFHAKMLKKVPYGSLPIRSKKQRIVLLDEPDAHMHPRLIKKFIDLILLSDDFDLLNMQLIMTTHNPLTLSFVPIENVFIVSNESVLRAQTKGYAQTIQLLTQNLICLNEPFRLVFVEANDDKKFYEMILMFLRNFNQNFLPYPISFLSLSLKQSEDSTIRSNLKSKNFVGELVEKFMTTMDKNE